MEIDNNGHIVIGEADLPFNDTMSRMECYYKGMYDMALNVRQIVDNAKLAKEQHNYMWYSHIIDGLISELTILTDNVTNQINR